MIGPYPDWRVRLVGSLAAMVLKVHPAHPAPVATGIIVRRPG